MAEATAEKNGLFYDEKVNRKAMGCISNLVEGRGRKDKGRKDGERRRERMEENVYEGFDFSWEGEVRKE